MWEMMWTWSAPDLNASVNMGGEGAIELIDLHFLDEFFALRVVDSLDLFVIEEVLFGGGVLDELKAVLVEGEFVTDRAEISHFDSVRNVLSSFLKGCAGICLDDASIFEFEVVVEGGLLNRELNVDSGHCMCVGGNGLFVVFVIWFGRRVKMMMEC